MNTNVTPAISNSLYSAGNARHLSGALMVSIAPIVHHDLFQEWDDFVTDPLNNYWMYVHYNLLSIESINSIPFNSVLRKQHSIVLSNANGLHTLTRPAFFSFFQTQPRYP